jgi:hypothetical protein
MSRIRLLTGYNHSTPRSVTIASSSSGIRTFFPPHSGASGLLVRDVILTRDEAKGLTQEYLYSSNPRRVGISLGEWLERDDVRQSLGRVYSSELERHFR